MGNQQKDDRPLGPVQFMNRAAFVVGSLIAALAVYFGTAGVLSLEMVAK